MAKLERSALVTGLDGMVGPHLAKYLLTQGFSVSGTVKPGVEPFILDHLLPKTIGINVYSCDLRNPQAVKELVERVKPDYLFHLAALSRPRTSWEDQTYPVNTASSANLIQSVASLSPKTRFIFVSTAAVYAAGKSGVVIDETSPLQPRDPYAESKLATERLLGIYGRKLPEFDYVIARPTNHTGFGRPSDFVECEIADQVLEIEQQKKDGVTVVNKLGGIDLLNVEDVVKAYALIAEKGIRGEAYTIASGKESTIEGLARLMLVVSGVDSNPNRFIIKSSGTEQTTNALFSNAKVEALGWNPQVSLEETLRGVLEWRR